VCGPRSERRQDPSLQVHSIRPSSPLAVPQVSGGGNLLTSVPLPAAMGTPLPGRFQFTGLLDLRATLPKRDRSHDPLRSRRAAPRPHEGHPAPWRRRVGRRQRPRRRSRPSEATDSMSLIEKRDVPVVRGADLVGFPSQSIHPSTARTPGCPDLNRLGCGCQSPRPPVRPPLPIRRTAFGPATGANQAAYERPVASKGVSKLTPMPVDSSRLRSVPDAHRRAPGCRPLAGGRRPPSIPPAGRFGLVAHGRLAEAVSSSCIGASHGIDGFRHSPTAEASSHAKGRLP
jgi:hypothetical protein